MQAAGPTVEWLADLRSATFDVVDDFNYPGHSALPVVEHTDLFKRAIGEYTDVVEKEMYTFTDLGGGLRLDAASRSDRGRRAHISNGLPLVRASKSLRQGPMFGTKPQKGSARRPQPGESRT